MCIYQTHGNPHAHVILRGGKAPNYHQADIDIACDTLNNASLPPRIMVDCSHGNSNKDHTRQIEVAESLAQQVKQGNSAIFGVMVESFIVEGKQDVVIGQPLTYGQSITDACINLDTSEQLLDILAAAVEHRKD